MASIGEYRSEQLDKLERLRQLGVDLYPSKSDRDTDLKELLADFDSSHDKEVCLAGRLVSHRQHSKIHFIDLESSGSTIQLIADTNLPSNYKKGELGFADLNLLTRGDIIEARGLVTRSKSNEPSIKLSNLRLLTKVLRPLPEKLDDKETRLRRRYLDLAINPEIRQRFQRRSLFWQATRDFLNQQGFIEINTPVLEHTTGGADAKPFVTHMEALDEDFYLRISHELPLKRLLGGGFEKVYDIGPRFRNENYSDEHLPEHISMEWYWAYVDWRAGMQLSQDMIRKVVQAAFGTTTFDWQGHKIDLAGKWTELDYASVIKENYGVDIFNTTVVEVNAQLKKHSLVVEKASIPRGIDKLWKRIRQDIAGPAWLINEPAYMSPLSKTKADNPLVAERFHAVIAGSEVVNGFSELNDPLEQLDKFIEQQRMRDAGDDEAQMLDIDYVEMLEYGMPPACGMSYSERLFWILEGVPAREGVPFPHLRHEIDETTRQLYPQVYSD